MVLFCVVLAILLARVRAPKSGHFRSETSTRASEPASEETTALVPVSSRSADQTNGAIAAESAAAISPLAYTTGNAKQRQAALEDSQFLTIKGGLRDYRAAMGQYPIGTNSEITNALFGANPRGAQFLGPEAKRNENRELVDQWGHPYFFHQISGRELELRSSGADGVMWNKDDEVSP